MQVNEILAVADMVEFVRLGVTTELNESVLRPNKRSLGMCSVPRQSSDSLRPVQRFVTAYRRNKSGGGTLDTVRGDVSALAGERSALITEKLTSEQLQKTMLEKEHTTKLEGISDAR